MLFDSVLYACFDTRQASSVLVLHTLAILLKIASIYGGVVCGSG